MKYRLPTEAEWEYACRAGSDGLFSFSNKGILRDHAWYKSNSDKMTHLVGMKKPNKWGLYDMHGNVWEWCSDRYDEKYYQYSPIINPQCLEEPTNDRIYRGGSWFSEEKKCRAAYRGHKHAKIRNDNVGLRIVMSV